MLPAPKKSTLIIGERARICLEQFTNGTEALRSVRLTDTFEIEQREEHTEKRLLDGILDELETRLSNEFARFNLWASNIGVFAEVQLSLDFRVREEPELKDSFLGHLDIIEGQLLQCKSSEEKYSKA